MAIDTPPDPVSILIEALEFYGHLGTHGRSARDFLTGNDSPIHNDMGDRAREALARYKAALNTTEASGSNEGK